MERKLKNDVLLRAWFDLTILFSTVATLFVLFAVLLSDNITHSDSFVELQGYAEELKKSDKFTPFSSILKELYAQVPSSWDEICSADMDEVPEYSAVLYATEPIGRYYITAYNHLETGSKMTASGKTCHEGTITTCAADPRYHKFGEYLEIGGRLYVVEDTGSAVKKRHIDLYFASYKEMARYNSHHETIYKVTFPFGKPKYM